MVNVQNFGHLLKLLLQSAWKSNQYDILVLGGTGFTKAFIFQQKEKSGKKTFLKLL